MRNGSLALYEDPRAATLRIGQTVKMVSVLGIWTDGEVIKFLIADVTVKVDGVNARFTAASTIELYAGRK